MLSLVAAGVLLGTPSVRADECACDRTVAAATGGLDGTADAISPGEVICLATGVRGRLTLTDIQGTASAPVIIQNCDGIVELDDRLGIYGSEYVRVTGTGSAESLRGIHIAAPESPQAVDLSAYSSHIEIDHVEISASGFAGIMAKTDGADPETFVQYGPHLHHNYIHDVDGEGMYIGYSFYAEDAAHTVADASIHDNIVVNTGWDGIQVGAADQGVEIYDNYVDSTGLATDDFQQRNGIQMGAGTRGRAEGNVVVRAGAHGLIMLGIGDTVVANNLMFEPGADGVWFSPRYFERAGVHEVGVVANNTIIQPGDAGIQIHSLTVTTDNQVSNNLVVAPAVDFADIDPAVTVVEATPLYADSIAEAGLAGGMSWDDLQMLPAEDRREALIAAYSLNSGSPAIDAGTDLSSYGIARDIAGTPRSDGAWDIGAWEQPPDGAADAGPDANEGPADANPTADATPVEPATDDGCDCHSTRSQPGLPGAAFTLAFVALILRRKQRAH